MYYTETASPEPVTSVKTDTVVLTNAVHRMQAARGRQHSLAIRFAISGHHFIAPRSHLVRTLFGVWALAERLNSEQGALKKETKAVKFAQTFHIAAEFGLVNVL